MNKTIPVNNQRLSFGLPLDKIGMDGNLHPGLRALFLKAYLSAGSRGYSWCPSAAKIVLQALSSGVDGQGSLSERMFLKERLEEGCWIVDTPAPPGASLWLIRHFIGRLPDPLLRGEHWRQLASECNVAIQHMHTSERTVCPVHKLIARSLSSIRKEEYLVLAALFNLVHDLSMDRKSGHLNWVAIKSLVQYFTPSLVTRPFIPGLTTEGDCHFHPMMLMTCYYWPEVRLWCYHLDHTSIFSSILPSATTPSKTSWGFQSEIKQQKKGETTMHYINLDVMCLGDSLKSHREDGVGQLMGLVNNSLCNFPHQTHAALENVPKIECFCRLKGHKPDGLYARKEDREVETNINHVIDKRTKTQWTQCSGISPEKGRDSGLVYTLVHKKAEALVKDCSSQYEDDVSPSEDERYWSKDLRKTICDDNNQQNNSLRFGLSHMFSVDQLYKKYNSNADGSLYPVQRVKSADKINYYLTKTLVHRNKDSKSPNSVTHYDQSESEMYSPFSEDTKYFSSEDIIINSPHSVPICNSEGKQLFCVTQEHSNRKDKLLISPKEEDSELRIQHRASRELDTSGKSEGVQIVSGFIESTGRLETSRKPEDDKMVADFIESARRLETSRMSKDDQTIFDFKESAGLLETSRMTEGNKKVTDFIERARLLETSKQPEGDQTIADFIERARLLETSRKSEGDQTVTDFIESIKCSSTPNQGKITDGLSIPFDCNQLTALDDETWGQHENTRFKYNIKKIRNLLSLKKTKKPTENKDLEHNILTDNNLKDEGGKHSELSTKFEDQFFMQSESKSSRFRFIKTFKRKSRSFPKHYRQWNAPQESPNLLDADLDSKNRWGRGRRARLGHLTSVFGSLINLWEQTPFNRGQSFRNEAKDVSVGDLIDLKD